MLSNGQPIEHAPHSMQFPKLTRFFRCSSFHSYTPAGQKWLQYLPLHFVAQTVWSTTSMCARPVSSLNLTVKSLSVSFSIRRPRTVRVEVPAQLGRDVRRVHVGDEPEVELRGRLCGQHRLRPGALVAGGHARDVARGREQQLLDHPVRRRVADQPLESHQALALADLRIDLREHPA